MKPLVLALLSVAAAVDAADPIVIADLEARDYGSWEVSGTAFGSRPANGTLLNQQEVSGFQGNGLINSFLGETTALAAFSLRRFELSAVILHSSSAAGGIRGKHV